MILEKFIESLSEYEKDHLLSLLKNDERLKQEAQNIVDDCEKRINELKK